MLPRLGVRQRVRAAPRALSDLRYRLGLRRLGAKQPAQYRDYLETQLERSLSKRDNDPGVGARLLVERVAAANPARDARVLCVGCRNGVELDEFRSRGFRDVTGIDLFSQRDDILVMDMHDMTFPDDSFAVVYSSHSLEHAYDVETVVRELARVGKEGALVAAEVPVRHRGSSADRTEFAGLDALREVFGPYIGEELWADEQPPNTPTNEQGSHVARLVFRLRKNARHMLRT
jgi:SAM-dependent methyltransferase